MSRISFGLPPLAYVQQHLRPSCFPVDPAQPLTSAVDFNHTFMAVCLKFQTARQCQIMYWQCPGHPSDVPGCRQASLALGSYIPFARAERCEISCLLKRGMEHTENRAKNLWGETKKGQERSSVHFQKDGYKKDGEGLFAIYFFALRE